MKAGPGSRSRARPKVMLVSSGGGHWVELLRLRPAFEGLPLVYVTVSNFYRGDVEDGVFYTVRDVTRWNRILWCLTAAKLLLILLRERPDTVVSTGALPGYFAIRLARLLGVRCVWVDSIANAGELSMSGRKAGPYVQLWLTQWEELARDGGPEFRGKVL